MNLLYVFDSTELLRATLGTEEGCPFFDAIHREQINRENVFAFAVPANHEDSEYVVEGHLVAFKDLDQNFQLFEIVDVEEEHNAQQIKHVICQNAALELNDEIITDRRPTEVTAGLALEQVLRNTRWQVGRVDELGVASTSFYYESGLSAIQKILNTWKGEVRYRVEISVNRIVGRYIDILDRRGAITGKRMEYKRDITSMRRVVDIKEVKTALYGRGKGEEVYNDDDSDDPTGYGRRLTFAGVEWSEKEGDPTDKPLGQEWVGDAESRVLFGRPDADNEMRHRFGVFEISDEEDEEELLKQTYEQLQEQKKPLVMYELDAVDLEQLSGYEHEAVRIGDTIIVIDREFKPALTVQARIIEVERYLGEPERTKVRLGDFRNLNEDGDKLRAIEAQLNERAGIWDDKYTSGHPLPTGWLEGVIDTLQNEVRSTGGYVYITDADGLIVYDKPENQSPTKAIRLKGGILAIANEKEPVTGEWNWRTFGTGDGFTADVITSGVLNAALINIIAGSGQGQIQLNENGFYSLDSEGRTRILINVRDFGGQGADPATARFFDANGKVVGSVGSNTNNHFAIGGPGSFTLDVVQNALYNAQQHRFVPLGATEGHYLQLASIENTSGNAREIYLRSPFPNTGYIGSASYRWWRIYTNHVHYNELHQISTREAKSNIQDADIDFLASVFDDIQLRTFNYKRSDDSAADELSVGMIAEESPEFLQSDEGKAINFGNYVSVMAGTVKKQQRQIDELNQRFERLEQDKAHVGFFKWGKGEEKHARFMDIFDRWRHRISRLSIRRNR